MKPMENKKSVTAVYWLYAHLLPFLNFSDVEEREYYRKYLTEAKNMEKEQLIDFYCTGYLDTPQDDEVVLLRKVGEQHYNENYE